MSKDDEEPKNCEVCEGRRKLTCPECHGIGEAIGPDGKIHPCVTEITCWACGGSGKVSE